MYTRGRVQFQRYGYPTRKVEGREHNFDLNSLGRTRNSRCWIKQQYQTPSYPRPCNYNPRIYIFLLLFNANYFIPTPCTDSLSTSSYRIEVEHERKFVSASNRTTSNRVVLFARVSNVLLRDAPRLRNATLRFLERNHARHLAVKSRSVFHVAA